MRFDTYLFRFFIIWYICGVFLLSFDLVPPWLEWANVVFLITSGLLAAVFFYRTYNKVLGLIFIGVVFSLSMIMESFGVATGLFFGDYVYKTDFGPKLIGVPVTIGFAWLMVIGTSHVLAKPLGEVAGRFAFAVYTLYASLIAVGIDLIIDPVAYDVKEYWVWLDDGFYYGIPFSNYLGWFVLSFVLHTVIFLLGRKNGVWRTTARSDWSRNMRWLYLLMTLMFIIVALVNGLFLASAVSSVCLLVIYSIDFSLRKSRNGGIPREEKTII
ncbi:MULTISPECIES: carotenoid biosynthesis protein [Alteribacter]|uniref:Carotenoid biosynthesis protein n=1 Tax=Alteribacter keqinensis TaxID=2483800 RepID=A0A3M7TVN6_9BACI|nr:MULTISPECIES: carotenoid biosynthesis protein [Alteribacter]MBM7097217.1 carotenoid biosynthesis protein [Alteribacter salitolerans]RNA69042.1 carotenoid biosynthesis protein [Alteribacter keqinensis]